MAWPTVLKTDRKERLGVATQLTDIKCLYPLIQPRDQGLQAPIKVDRLQVQSDALDDELIFCNEKGSRRCRASKV